MQVTWTRSDGGKGGEGAPCKQRFSLSGDAMKSEFSELSREEGASTNVRAKRIFSVPGGGRVVRELGSKGKKTGPGVACREGGGGRGRKGPFGGFLEMRDCTGGILHKRRGRDPAADIKN